MRLKDSDGNWMESEKEIHNIIASSYKRLYKSGKLKELDKALNAIPPVISEEENSYLCSPITNAKIKDAIF